MSTELPRVRMEKWVTTRRLEWLRERQHGVGASESAALVGVHPFLSPLRLYELKVRDDPEPPDGSEWMEAGTRLQPVITAWWAERTGHVVRASDPWKVAWLKGGRARGAPLFTTLDALVKRTQGLAGPGVLEVKNVSEWKAADWLEDPPLHHQVQLQHQLHVKGYGWGYLVALVGGNRLRWSPPLQYAPDFAQELERRVAAFWREHVLERRPPEPVDAEDLKAAGRLFPRSVVGSEAVRLPRELLKVDARILELQAQERERKAELERLKAQVALALGEAEVGKLGGSTWWSWRTQDRQEYVVPASTFRVLRRSES